VVEPWFLAPKQVQTLVLKWVPRWVPTWVPVLNLMPPPQVLVPNLNQNPKPPHQPPV
jgi:hypothetical protein